MGASLEHRTPGDRHSWYLTCFDSIWMDSEVPVPFAPDGGSQKITPGWLRLTECLKWMQIFCCHHTLWFMVWDQTIWRAELYSYQNKRLQSVTGWWVHSAYDDIVWYQHLFGIKGFCELVKPTLLRQQPKFNDPEPESALHVSADNP